MPSAVAGLIAGAGLSIAGLLMQTFFRNPIAGPYLLGVSSGASLGVAVLLFIGGGAVSVVGGAILGAAAVLAIILMAGWRLGDGNPILIVGMMVGGMASAIVELLQYFGNAQTLQRYVFWAAGSLQGLGFLEIGIMATGCALAGIGAFLLAKPLNLLLLGEDNARGLGVSVRGMRVFLLAASALLAGVITAYCGMIGFVGTAVPHLARGVYRTADHRWLLIGSGLLGGLVLLLCQWIAQIAVADQILPLNALTSLIGAPIVVWIVWRQARY